MDVSNDIAFPSKKLVAFVQPDPPVNIGPHPVGYDCEFVDTTPKSLQTECSICLLTLREPHLISCCGHNFCRCCIEAIYSSGKPCPLCNTPGFTSLRNKGLERTLKELQVRCPNCSLGCLWAGELGKLDEHVNSVCLWSEIECEYKCGLHCKRRDAVGHQLVCPCRPFTCRYCGDYSSHYGNVVNNHWPICAKYPVFCPNDCGRELARALVQKHVADECPLTNVDCEFVYAGCKTNIQRKDMGTHLAAEVGSHLMLVSLINRQLLLSNQQLMEENKATKDLVISLTNDNRLMQLKISYISKALGKDLLLPPLKFSPYQELRVFSKLTLLQPTQDFYSHLGGYKLQARVYAQDELKKLGTVLYLLFYLQKGEYDEYLSWPFRGAISVKVGSEQYSIDFQNAPEGCKSRVHQGEISESGYGLDKPVGVMRVNYKMEITIVSVTLPAAISV